MESQPTKEFPGVARLDVPSEDPFVLFNEWYDEAKQSDILMPQTFTLATVGRDGKASARSLVLRRLDADGFVFVTDSRSRKSQDLAEVPSGAMVFFWCYKMNGENVLRQVRVEGCVQEISPEESRAIYEDELPFYKMRSHICHQGTQVEWQDLQDSYFKLLGEMKEGRTLSMPDHYVGYKLIADVIEFYYSETHKIADRVQYQKNSEGKWTNYKIAA